jgi:Tfp pilus assembly protein PilO
MMRAIFGILALVIAGGVFLVYTQPTYNTMQQTQAQIAQYDAALSKATELQQLKQTLLARDNAFDPNDLDRLQKMLPDHVDNVRLVLDMDNLATHYGLALQNVDVSGATTPTAPTASAQTAAVAAIGGAAGTKYDSLTLHFSTQGTYATFTQFLQALESSLRVVDLVTLSISPAGTQQVAGQAVSGEPKYTYDITIRTYWLK